MNVQPTPDSKDWTWVLGSVCTECGQDVRALNPGQIAGLVRGSVELFTSVLQRADVRERPSPQVWSPLEYCAHISDMYQVMNERLELIINQETPVFANWDQDEAAIRNNYGGLDPMLVAQQLSDSAGRFAGALESLNDQQITRTGYRSNGSVFTAATLAQYAWHDAIHHLHDLDV